MHECLLCSRDMKVSDEVFGKDCDEFEFDSEEKKEFPISFNTRDLYFA